MLNLNLLSRGRTQVTANTNLHGPAYPKMTVILLRSPQAGSAPSSWSRGEVKQQTADDREALEKLDALLRTKEHVQTRLAIAHPETDTREGDQRQRRPAWP